MGRLIRQVVAYWWMVLVCGGAWAAKAMGWDSPVKFAARMGAVGLAATLAIAGVGAIWGSAAVTALCLVAVFAVLFLLALIVVPARLHHETHPDDDDHEINLVFDENDGQFFHEFANAMHAHVAVYNKTRRSIPDVSILIGVPQFSADNTSFSRAKHIRAGNVPLGWCHLPANDPMKHKAELLPPGESLADVLVAGIGEQHQGRNFFRLEVEERHGEFRILKDHGFYKLRIRAASPNASSAPLDLLVEWRGDPMEIRVRRISPPRSRERT